MFHHVKATRIEVEEETIIEVIPTFDTLDDGWEEMILFASQVELKRKNHKFCYPSQQSQKR